MLNRKKYFQIKITGKNLLKRCHKISLRYTNIKREEKNGIKYRNIYKNCRKIVKIVM